MSHFHTVTDGFEVLVEYLCNCDLFAVDQKSQVVLKEGEMLMFLMMFGSVDQAIEALKAVDQVRIANNLTFKNFYEVHDFYDDNADDS